MFSVEPRWGHLLTNSCVPVQEDVRDWVDKSVWMADQIFHNLDRHLKSEEEHSPSSRCSSPGRMSSGSACSEG